MLYFMPKTDFIRGNRALSIIKQGSIHKFDLISKLGMSLSSYEKFKPWFEHTYRETVMYDIQTKKWSPRLE